MSAVPAGTLDRKLFVHDDPAAVGAWCRERATTGCIFVAPSASARRHALQRVVDERGVTLGITVASRSRLLPLLEVRAGLATPAMLPPSLERLLVAESARAARVPLFDDEGFDAPAGAVSAVASLIRALRMNGITPEQYQVAGGDARAADAYRRFESRRTALGFHDEADRIARVVAAGVPAMALVLEDPALMHRAGHDLLAAAIGAASSCHVGFSQLAPAGAASPTLARLEAMGLVEEAERGEQAHTIAPVMRAIGGVGMHDEVDLVARQMLQLLRSATPVVDARAPGGTRPVRPCDILGVAPNGTYLTLLADACARIGIPVASPRRMDALDVPVVRALLEAFRLLADEEEDTPERGLALLGAPYVGLSLRQHDRLARALTLRGIGGMRSWRRFATGAGSRKFQQLAQEVTRLAAHLQGERPPRELAGTLASLALDHGFLSSGRRAHLEAGRDDAVRLDQQGWECLTTAVEELNDALRHLGIARMNARRWLAELVAVLSESQVKVDAKAIDGVHLTVMGAGLPAAPHVYAVGWREGLVPRRLREDPLLPDRVKRALNEQGAMFQVGPDHAAHEHEKRERVRRAARETLTISWPATGEDGDHLLPSFYLDDLGVTDRQARSVGDNTWPLALASSRGERVARATFLARHRTAASLDGELQAVKEALAALTPAERKAYDGVLHAGQVCQLPPEIVAEAATLARAMSASQARMLAHCQYGHFGKRRLKLESLVAPDVDLPMLGKIAHAVLNDIGRAGFDQAALDATIEKWWNKHVKAEQRDEPGVVFEREMLEQQLAELVERERAHLETAAGRATYFELAFGLEEEGRDPASLAHGLEIALPPGTPLSHSVLRGSMDRVDVVERDGVRYGVAIDYKSGKGESYVKEFEDGADFQLPIYCEVMPAFDMEPVGAFFLGIASGERYGVVREDFADAFVPEGAKGVKRLGAEAFRAYMRERQEGLRAEIARLARGELAVRPRKDDCKYCDLRPVCRIGTFGVGGTHGEE